MTPLIWITGVAGFTGRHLVRYLRSNLREDVRILGLDIRADSPSPELDFYYQADLNDSGLVSDIASRKPPARIFHLAALLPPAKEPEMWYVNAGGTVSLIRGLAKAGCSAARLVCVGSASEYLATESGLLDETSPCGGETGHGRTKWAQTTLALQLGRQLGMETMVVRPFNLIGPGLPTSLVAGALCAQFADPAVKQIRVGNIYSERDFIDIRDAVRAYWLVMEKGRSGEVYNVCSGIPTRIETLLEIFAELTESPPEIEIDPRRLRKIDLDRVYGSREKIFKATGWQPEISLRQSLADMLEEARVEKRS